MHKLLFYVIPNYEIWNYIFKIDGLMQFLVGLRLSVEKNVWESCRQIRAFDGLIVTTIGVGQNTYNISRVTCCNDT